MSSNAGSPSLSHPNGNGKHDPHEFLDDWMFVCPTGELANAIAGLTVTAVGLNAVVWHAERNLRKPDVKGKKIIVVCPSDKKGMARSRTIKSQCRKAGALSPIREWVLHGLGSEFPTLADWKETFDLGKSLLIDRPWLATPGPDEETPEPESPPPSEAKTHVPGALYYDQDNCLFRAGNKKLANFTARITEQITRHEGGSETIRFKIRAKHFRKFEREIVIEHKEYSSMAWCLSLGAEFAIEPGRESKDLLRHAIQILSDADGSTRSIQHTSLGWIKHDGEWLYLHAGGAIGANGHSKVVGVDVHPSLCRYRLPEAEPDRSTLERAINAHCDVWSLAKDGASGGRGVAAILATLPWRAVLSAFDASIHFGGPSGNFKTSAARIAYQHFSDVRGSNAPMPADWRSTVNALQRLTFDVRDSLLIVDDLKLDEDKKKAEILIQSQGNLQSRLRMNADQRMHQSLDPRGSVLSTGEIDPRTSSTLGRSLMNEIRKGDIDLIVLSRLQEAADHGLFASLMWVFLRWLAARLDAVREHHEASVAAIRAGLGPIEGTHSRHPDIVAELTAAYGIFMRFAVESKLIAQGTADAYVSRAKELLIELARAQVELQEESRAGRLFLSFITSALHSQRAHLLVHGSDSEPSRYPLACGWRQERDKGSPVVTWRVPSGSRRIGYIDESKSMVFLDPHEATAIAVEMARAQNILQSFANIGRELLSEELVEACVEKDRNAKAATPVRIKNVGLKRCFCVPIANLFDPEPVTQVTLCYPELNDVGNAV